MLFRLPARVLLFDCFHILKAFCRHGTGHGVGTSGSFSENSAHSIADIEY